MSSLPVDAPEHGARAPARRVVVFLLHWRIFVPLALLIAAGLWLGVGPWLIRHTVSFDITVEQGGQQWALEWHRASDGRTDGAWLDFTDFHAGPETLEIRPAGSVTGGAATSELWLYAVTPARPGAASLDLKSIIRTASPDDLQGRWVPFDAGPGIVYSDSKPGLLRLRVPAGGVVLQMAKTATSGTATVTYADDVKQVDLHSAAIEHLQLLLTRKSIPAGQSVHVAQTLPHYEISSLALRWQNSPGTIATVSNATLLQRVLGIRVESRPLQMAGDCGQVSGGAQLTPFEIRPSAAAGEIVFLGSTGLGRAANLVGVGGLWLLLLGLRLAGSLVGLLRRRMQRWGALLDGVALALVIAAHLGMAVWFPLLLANDSIDYLGDAAVLVDTGSLSHFGYYRTPGYSIFVAPFLMVFHDFATALGYAQAVLGILTAYLVFRILKAFLPRPWPALGLLLVGLDPVSLAYERYALTECLTAFCVALTGWLLIWQYARCRAAIPTLGSVLLGALVIGAVVGISAYVRPNLQMLIVLVPPFLVLSCWRVGVRWRVLAQAALIGVVALGCVTPWLWRNQTRYGRVALALGAQINRVGGLWNFGALDIDQAALFPYDRWQALRHQAALGRLSVYDLLPAITASSASRQPARSSEPVASEEVYRQTAGEAFARHPGRAFRSMGVALASQLGLWPRFNHPSAAENAAWSAPLRGESGLGPTNFPPVPASDARAAQLRALAQRSERNITYLRDSTAARWFSELFWTYRQARPFLALLFLAGVAFSVGARLYALTSLGLLVLTNAVALAVLVFSPIDRYSAPFQPLLSAIAVYALFRLVMVCRGSRAVSAEAHRVLDAPQRVP